MRCATCGLVWVDPMPSAAELARYYDDAYRDGAYTEWAAADDIRMRIAEYRLSVIRREARPGRWLDVGCAAGHFVEAAQRAGIKSEGLDISAGAISRARARGLTAHVARVEDFAPAAPFDTVTAFDVIEHTLNPGEFVDRLRGWLVPGGTLVLTLPNVRSIYPRMLTGRHWFYYVPSEHLYYFDPHTIRQLLVPRGFAVRHIRRAYKPLTLQYIVTALKILSPRLGRLVTPATYVLPRWLLARVWRVYVGEMMVIAAAGSSGA